MRPLTCVSSKIEILLRPWRIVTSVSFNSLPKITRRTLWGKSWRRSSTSSGKWRSTLSKKWLKTVIWRKFLRPKQICVNIGIKRKQSIWPLPRKRNKTLPLGCHPTLRRFSMKTTKLRRRPSNWRIKWKWERTPSFNNCLQISSKIVIKIKWRSNSLMTK